MKKFVARHAAPHLQNIVIDATGPLFFISDLHLSPRHQAVYQTFKNFLLRVIDEAQRLFILGDLFNFWLGDDCLNRDTWARKICADFTHVTKRGVRVYVLEGNRDFLLGQRFMAESGAHFLSPLCCLYAFDKKIVLTHGDLLCTKDRLYQYYRKFFHLAWVQNFFLRLPYSWRLALAQRLHRLSQNSRAKHKPKAKNELLPPDIDHCFAQKIMEYYAAEVLIHGHTHRPQAEHQAYGSRYVLPSWDDKDHDAGYLRIDMTGIHLVNLKVQSELG